MHKRIIEPPSPESGALSGDWLDLEDWTQVELTSEDPAHPVESALLPGGNSGWRAAQPGDQTIRLFFDRPQRLKRIHLVFTEAESPRTQEFILRWLPADAGDFQEIVRQQWNFSPPGTTREVEDYRVDLAGVKALELEITPDKAGGPARASLTQLRLA